MIGIASNKDLIDNNFLGMNEEIVHKFVSSLSEICYAFGMHPTLSSYHMVVNTLIKTIGEGAFGILANYFIKYNRQDIEYIEALMKSNPHLTLHRYHDIIPTMNKLVSSVHDVAWHSVNEGTESAQFDMDRIRVCAQPLSSHKPGDIVFITEAPKELCWYSYRREMNVELTAGSIVKIKSISGDGIVVDVVKALTALRYVTGPACLESEAGSLKIVNHNSVLAIDVSLIAYPQDELIVLDSGVKLAPACALLNTEILLTLSPHVRIRMYDYPERESCWIESKLDDEGNISIAVVNPYNPDVTIPTPSNFVGVNMNAIDLDRMLELTLNTAGLTNHRMEHFIKNNLDGVAMDVIGRTLTINSNKDYLMLAPLLARDKVAEFLLMLSNDEYKSLLQVTHDEEHLRAEVRYILDKGFAKRLKARDKSLS